MQLEYFIIIINITIKQLIIWGNDIQNTINKLQNTLTSRSSLIKIFRLRCSRITLSLKESHSCTPTNSEVNVAFVLLFHFSSLKQ